MRRRGGRRGWTKREGEGGGSKGVMRKGRKEERDRREWTGRRKEREGAYNYLNTLPHLAQGDF